MTTVIDVLMARGFVHQITETGLKEAARSPLTWYVGFDPTAPSLHVGHLLPVMALSHCQRAGQRVIVLVGGATGLIGDPSGKTGERPLLSREDVSENAKGLQRQLSRFLDFSGGNAALMADNAEWLGDLRLLEFLRDVGKHFSVNAMIAKESVRMRLEDRERGISFSEFSYMLLQAYDYLHLYDRFGCQVQMGGSDQYGNITAGIGLIRRVRGIQVHGVTLKLLQTASGEKFGKTGKGTVWLDESLTSPFGLYQFWLNADDRDVIGYLNLFTFLPSDEIEALAQDLSARPEDRKPHRRLAFECVRIVHGEEAARVAMEASEVLFGAERRRGPSRLTAAQLKTIREEVPSTPIPADAASWPIPLVDLVPRTGIATGRGEARRLIQDGAVSVNGEKVRDRRHVVFGRLRTWGRRRPSRRQETRSPPRPRRQRLSAGYRRAWTFTKPLSVRARQPTLQPSGAPPSRVGGCSRESLPRQIGTSVNGIV